MNRPLWTRNRQPDDCDMVDPLLSLYADGMASEEESRRVEAHLPTCVSCRQSLVWMQATRRALAARPIQLPPADLRARISSAIAASSILPAPVRPARVFALRSAYAAAASLTLLGVLAGYGLLKPKPAAHVPAAPPKIALLPPSGSAPSGASASPAPPTHPSHRAGGITHPAVVATSPRPHVKSLSTSERIASAGVRDEPLSRPAARAIARIALSHVPGPKTPARVLSPTEVHPRLIPSKKPVLAIPPAKLVATRPASKPSLETTPNVIPPARSAAPDKVAAAPVPPTPVSQPSEPPAIVKENPKPIVTASVPPPSETGENHFHTVDLSVVRQYALANRASLARDLNLAGRTAIRTTVHTTALTSSLEAEAGKIDITHGDIR